MFKTHFKKSFSIITILLLSTSLSFAAPSNKQTPKLPPTLENPKAPKEISTTPIVVDIETSMGTMTAELYPDKAPLTVENFLRYAREKKYEGTIFHRVIDNFMIQGGGYLPGMKEIKTYSPIQNEAGNGLLNEKGTLSMARLPSPHSATAQFFINIGDNTFLNQTSKTDDRGFGYAVFGRLIKGLPVLMQIGKVQTTKKQGHLDVPEQDIVIKSIKEIPSAKK
jgi:peptidyl-prolyl cis-trans isomerase B (cyclophilin B)